jgi:Protoglobin
MQKAQETIPGYTYGSADVSASPVSIEELGDLMRSAGFSDDDARHLRLAGEVLKGQTKAIVDHWRGRIIASIPRLARHSRTPEGGPIPIYLANSNARFQQWILDTCFRSYDRQWLDYQREIALRHTIIRKNATDGVRSTPYVPLRDAIAFVAVMNETIRPYLAAHGHSAEEIARMHLAWCNSLQIQMALWVRAYLDSGHLAEEW